MPKNTNTEELEIDDFAEEEVGEETEAKPRGRQRQPKAAIRDFLNAQIETLQGVVKELDVLEQDLEGPADAFIAPLTQIGQVGGRLRRMTKPYRLTFKPSEDEGEEVEPYTEEDITSFWNDYRHEH